MSQASTFVLLILRSKFLWKEIARDKAVSSTEVWAAEGHRVPTLVRSMTCHRSLVQWTTLLK